MRQMKVKLPSTTSIPYPPRWGEGGENSPEGSEEDGASKQG